MLRVGDNFEMEGNNGRLFVDGAAVVRMTAGKVRIRNRVRPSALAK